MDFNEAEAVNRTASPGLRHLDALVSLLESGTQYLEDIDDIEQVFDGFVQSREWELGLTKALHEVADDPMARLDRLSGTSFNIFKNTRFLLSVSKLQITSFNGAAADTSSVMATSAENSLQTVISPDASIRVTRYRLSEQVDLSVFDPGAALDLVSEDTLRPFRRPYRYHAGDVYDVKINGEACVVRLKEVVPLDYQWTFDGQSLSPLFSSVTLPSLGRVETSIDLAVRFSGDRIHAETAACLLKEMLRHRLHFVRWKAVQGLGEIDPDAALIALQEMRDDPHPHVRAAAIASCRDLFDGGDQR
jgi:hypothetical protein